MTQPAKTGMAHCSAFSCFWAACSLSDAPARGSVAPSAPWPASFSTFLPRMPGVQRHRCTRERDGCFIDGVGSHAVLLGDAFPVLPGDREVRHEVGGEGCGLDGCPFHPAVAREPCAFGGVLGFRRCPVEADGAHERTAEPRRRRQVVDGPGYKISCHVVLPNVEIRPARWISRLPQPRLRLRPPADQSHSATW